MIQTRPFQRLRRVKQLGFSDLVYPGATHSRFSHSVGVFNTARRLMEVISRDVHPAEDAKISQALAASLLHDVGHGPFSHAFESVGKRLNLKMASHELVSDALIRSGEIADALRPLGSGFAGDVADIISARGQSHIYGAVVSSQFDADRLDYMRRDRLMTGTEHAAIDFEWLMANLEVGTVQYGVDETSVGEVQTFVVGPKAIYAAEGYILGLFQLYPTVYFHKATRGAEKLFAELLTRVITLALEGSAASVGLSDEHPLIKFAKSPNEIERALALDDTVIWGALTLLIEAKDTIVAELSKRLRDRKLYKCIDVRVSIAHSKGDAASRSIEADSVCAKVKEELARWSADNSAGGSHRILLDEEKRSPYNRLNETKGPLDQINIRTDGGKLVDLAERSKVVAAIEIYKMFRIYHAEGDDKAKDMIHSVIEKEIASWPQ